jgi:hypothetical protein
MRMRFRGRGEHSLVVPTSLATVAVARSTTARPLAVVLVVLLVWATATLEQAEEDARRAGPPFRGLHSFPLPVNLSLLCPFPLNLSLLCPPLTLHVSGTCSS